MTAAKTEHLPAKISPDHPDFPLRFDHARSQILTAWGAKRTGKSALNRLVYDSWSGDKLCIDVNGNADPGIDAERITDLPKSWPAKSPALGERPRPQNLWYRAHPGSATFEDDLDRAVGLALYPQKHRCLLWAGEIGAFMRNGRPKPHMHTLLQQNRHHHVTALMDGPRPVYVDPLVLGQSDYVAVFELPNPHDRARIAQEIGFPPAKFERECFEAWNKGDHWFLLWHGGIRRLFRCPPLPIPDDGRGKGAA